MTYLITSKFWKYTENEILIDYRTFVLYFNQFWVMRTSKAGNKIKNLEANEKLNKLLMLPLQLLQNKLLGDSLRQFERWRERYFDTLLNGSLMEVGLHTKFWCQSYFPLIVFNTLISMSKLFKCLHFKVFESKYPTGL